MTNNIQGAFSSIWNNKITSLLTILGVVIGVTSVIVLISLGQGLKNDVSGMIQGMGSNVMAVVGGKIDTTKMQNNSQMNPAQLLSNDILTESDLRIIQATPGVKSAAPMSLVTTSVRYGQTVATPMIVGTTPRFLDAVEIIKLGSGQTISDNSDKNSIVISDNTKQQLFGDSEALGKKVMLGTTEFTVIGVLAKPADSIASGDFDNICMIPFDAATALNKNQVKIFRIIAKADSGSDPKVVKEAVRKAVLDNHNSEDNFTVLTQDDLLGLFDKFLNLATTMVTAIAAISLIVGGIGIMNIMLITVTERTREIGLRKAVGASRGAILSQFLIEAIIITLLGGITGLAISFLTNYLIAANSSLNPEITASTIVLALGISTLIGILFGLWPALRAAQKDPIEALRRE